MISKVRPIPPNRHQKNMLEPRHGPIRFTFIRLRHASPETLVQVLALRSVRVSNDLYISDVISAYEAAKGYTRPIHPYVSPVPVDRELLEAHSNLVARRKLTRILRLHSLTDQNFRLGDLVQVYQKQGHQKRGKLLSPRQAIDIDKDAWILSVPGSAGRKITVAFEDARAAHVQFDITSMIQESIDRLDEEIDDILDDHQSAQKESHESSPVAYDEGKESEEIHSLLDDVNPVDDVSDTSNDLEENTNPSLDVNAEPNHLSIDDSHHADDHQSPSEDFQPEEHIVPSVGDRVEIFWPLDNMHYPGHVSHITDTGQHVINYVDYDVETLTISDETWRYQSSLDAALGNFSALPSNEKQILKNIMDSFGNKPFVRHQAQGFEQFPILNAYRVEEEDFKKNVESVKRSCVPPGSNVISSHVIYKVKMNEDGSLKLKALIAPHGNEDSNKDQMCTDCCMCSSLGIRIVISVSTYKKWRII